MLTGGNYCPVCHRSDVEREYDEGECQMPTCPYQKFPCDDCVPWKDGSRSCVMNCSGVANARKVAW